LLEDGKFVERRVYEFLSLLLSKASLYWSGTQYASLSRPEIEAFLHPVYAKSNTTIQ